MLKKLLNDYQKFPACRQAGLSMKINAMHLSPLLLLGATFKRKLFGSVIGTENYFYPLFHFGKRSGRKDFEKFGKKSIPLNINF